MAIIPDDLALELGDGVTILGRVGTLSFAEALRIVAGMARTAGGGRPSPRFVRLAGILESSAANALRAFPAESFDRSSAVGVPWSAHSVVVDPISTADAAALLGCSAQSVRARCRCGEFASAVLVGDTWVIGRHEVEQARVRQMEGWDVPKGGWIPENTPQERIAHLLASNLIEPVSAEQPDAA